MAPPETLIPPITQRKVCIVCQGAYSGPTHEYMIFIVDLVEDLVEDAEIRKPRDPTVRFDVDSFFLAAFCVLGSKLFVFEGFNFEYNPKGGKSMLTYELCDGVSNLKLEKAMLSGGPTMNGVKMSPKATVTPHGKILVFSSVIDICWPNKFDFELFDPVTENWLSLPGLCPPSWVDRNERYFWIQSFTFMKRNVLFLRTEVGAFALDITRERWKTHGFRGDGYIPSHPGTSLVLIGKEMCIIPYCAYDIAEYGPDVKEDLFANLYFTFPEMSLFPETHYFQSGGVVLLEETPKEVHVCFLQSGINKESHPELLLQVYRCDLMECRKMFHLCRQKKVAENLNWLRRTREGFVLPGTKKIGIMTLMVEKAAPSYSFMLCSFASIPVASVPSRRTTLKRAYSI